MEVWNEIYKRSIKDWGSGLEEWPLGKSKVCGEVLLIMSRVFDKVNGVEYTTCSKELLEALTKELNVELLHYSKDCKKRYAFYDRVNKRITRPMSNKECHIALRQALSRSTQYI